MKYSVLASGSSGNALYVETERSRILVDAGLSGKQLENLLRSIDVDPSTLQAILVTHEHSDHVKGLGVFARRYRLPVYMNEATWENLPSGVGQIPPEQQHVFATLATLELEDLTVESFPISHDAAEPMGFCFHHEGARLGLVTDTGYINRRILEKVAGCDALIFESNHDVNMLRMGRYPWNVKRRILSDVGHLSNEDAGWALTEILRGNGEDIFLAHLSQDNNLTELAHLTVKGVLQEQGLRVGQDVRLWETHPDRPTPLATLEKKHRLL
ncbi:MBL fold metallo-hydrolase [Kroppenstedtia eburnea]|uniref:Phosphoribosyl 1,2-cyclic phosphodiesterase n=1 Tax=Kroppenstedtia eburnea TaxID=714067 RepID=A0A1N7JII2_9BACL|nr:MBL fold metallo-hydrolase [Kroppenstedtia eburnea]QKI83579.1 MBL fold metallo-hydrolase [Kroppenstedtia eburnea]SIS49066.1 Phosphoribosyl 1,2-cyclic phosphodiesterase [Kroppenstedtia eburnea]